MNVSPTSIVVFSEEFAQVFYKLRWTVKSREMPAAFVFWDMR